MTENKQSAPQESRSKSALNAEVVSCSGVSGWLHLPLPRAEPVWRFRLQACLAILWADRKLPSSRQQNRSNEDTSYCDT